MRVHYVARSGLKACSAVVVGPVVCTVILRIECPAAMLLLLLAWVDHDGGCTDGSTRRRCLHRFIFSRAAACNTTRAARHDEEEEAAE